MSGILGILLTPQQGPRVFSAGAALAPFPAQPFSLPRHLFSVEPVRLPSSDLHPLPRREGSLPQAPISPPLPTPPSPSAPGHRTAAKCKEEPAARLRACALGRASPTATTGHHLAAPGRWDAGGVGWGAQLGQGQCFPRGRGTAPGTSPSSESFPSGATECARGWRGGLPGVGWGWTESRPDPLGRVRREGEGRQRGPGWKPCCPL